MKKTVAIIVVVIMMLAVAGGAYWFGTRSETDDKNTNVAVTNANHANLNTNTAALTNASAPNVTYETYSNHGTLYTFDVVSEWTSIAPAEVQKSITEEQRHGYEIVYFSSNPDSVVLAVSEKASATLATMPAITADDKSVAQANPNVTIVDERVNQADAQTEMTVRSGDSTYTVYSRYLIISAAGSETRWALMEVTVPSSRAAQYGAAAAHLLDSLQIAGSNANTGQAGDAGGFSAAGEKINELAYRQNFSAIDLCSLKKDASPETARAGIASLDYETEQLSYRVVTTNAITEQTTLTLKTYDYAAGQVFAGEQQLDVMPGTNSLCCFSAPGTGRYQYLFYYGTDLVKALELSSE
ncbi:MAG: hypothetical protein WC505_01335 [Patescibacteria group bacterium]